jgi:hypothetical protein
MPLDPTSTFIADALGSLDLAGEDSTAELAWLDQSWAEPDAFGAALADYLGEHTGPRRPRSRLGAYYDLYEDLIARHAATDKVALRAWDATGREAPLSYAELHRAAGVWAGAWTARGVAPGAVVCLMLPLGADYLIALATALRLGLCISTLPPDAPAYAERRLAALAPEFVVVDPRLPPLKLPDDTSALPRGSSERPPAGPPFTYRAGIPCAKLFSPLRSPTDQPVTLTADDAYLGALRDGIFAYRLSPEDPLAAGEDPPAQPVLAAPGFHHEQHLPSLLFAALVLGATFLHVPDEVLAAQPEILGSRRIRALGITPRARDLLTAAAVPLLQVTLWFRNVGEPLDWLAWRRFVLAQKAARDQQELKLPQAPSSNVLVDAAAGGCLLFSLTRPGSLSARVLPAPGRPFALLDVGGGQEAVGGHGLFALRPYQLAPLSLPEPPVAKRAPVFPEAEAKAEAVAKAKASAVAVAQLPELRGFFILARQGAEFLYGSTVVPRRDARVYPRAEVAEALAAVPLVKGAAVVTVPSTQAAGAILFILLVFTGAATLDAEGEVALLEACGAALERMGKPLAPDRIERVPLHPRRDKTGAVDLAWCQRQYASGALARKARDPVFQQLTALRDLVQAPGGS